MADPYFADVALLLEFDGADGSTSFSDTSPSPKTVSISGGTPTISTAQSKYGGASLLLPATLSHLSIPSADFQFPPGSAFTVEFYLRLVALPSGEAVIIGLGAPGAGSGNDPVRSGWTISVSGTGVIKISIGDFGLGLYNTASSSIGLAVATWNHIAVVMDGSTVPKIYINGVVNATSQFGATSWAAVTPSEADSTSLFIGKFDARVGTPTTLNAHIDLLRVTKLARYTTGFTPPEPDVDTTAVVSAEGPLSQPSGTAATLATGTSQTSGPLGAVLAMAMLPSYGIASVASILGRALVLGIHDFSAKVVGASRYVMDLNTPSGTVRVPIGSWQATLQAAEPSYVQCVVPGAQPWVEVLSTATSFQISRSASAGDGTALLELIANAPLETLSLAQGAYNYSATLSGYSPAISSPAAVVRELQEVRTLFTYSTGYRVRCAIDWVLRPGHTASFSGTSFVVRYISYYVQGNDAFMDVGQ